MLPITRAPSLPYTATALKFRRADIAPAQGVEDIDEENTGMSAAEHDEEDETSFFVPLPFKGQLVDKWI